MGSSTVRQMPFFSLLDPVFKFIPKTSLLGLKVQNVVEIDLQMVLGQPSASPAVFKVNGPLTNGHAGRRFKIFHFFFHNFYASVSPEATNKITWLYNEKLLLLCLTFDNYPGKRLCSTLEGIHYFGRMSSVL